MTLQMGDQGVLTVNTVANPNTGTKWAVKNTCGYKIGEAVDGSNSTGRDFTLLAMPGAIFTGVNKCAITFTNGNAPYTSGNSFTMQVTG